MPNMRSAVTLKARDLENVTTFPSWVSNGHWALAKAAIVNAAMFASAEIINAAFPKVGSVNVRTYDDDRGMDRILASNGGAPLLPWLVTSWRVHRPAKRNGRAIEKSELTLVMCTHGDLTAFFDVDYFELLQVHAGDLIYGTAKADTAFRDKPVNTSDHPVRWVLMPVAEVITADELAALRGTLTAPDMPKEYAAPAVDAAPAAADKVPA